MNDKQKVSAPADNDALVQFFHRHVVPIYFSFKKGSERSACVVTSFVMSIYDQWFLVTAGHCIEEIEENLSKGYEIERCRLIDFMGFDAPHTEPIPFDYSESAATKLCYDPTYDYGLLFLDEHYVRLLRANGVQALTEEVWEQQPDTADFYMLLGVVGQLSEATPTAASVTSTLLKVIELPERPDAFVETTAPTLWGEVLVREPVTDIMGMSGGPVFSFRRTEDGKLRYWLHAVQSRWIPSRRLIAACLSRPLGTFLKEVMDGEHEHLVSAVSR